MCFWKTWSIISVLYRKLDMAMHSVKNVWIVRYVWYLCHISCQIRRCHYLSKYITRPNDCRQMLIESGAAHLEVYIRIGQAAKEARELDA